MKYLIILTMSLMAGCNMAPAPDTMTGDGSDNPQTMNQDDEMPMDDGQMMDQTAPPQSLDELRTSCEINSAERETLFAGLVDFVQEGMASDVSKEDAIPPASDQCEEDPPEWSFEACSECSLLIIEFVYQE